MRVLDLFSGLGGFSIGLESAGMETVAFCEIEEFPRKVLAKHWPDVPIYGDVCDLTKARLDEDGITGIDVICGGFPCTDLSVAGNQEGIDASRSGLWSEMCRLCGELRPRYMLVENVPALLTGDNGRWMGRVLSDLSKIGYDAEWHCIPASACGAKHHRDRIWIIAYPDLFGRDDITTEAKRERQQPPRGRSGIKNATNSTSKQCNGGSIDREDGKPQASKSGGSGSEDATNSNNKGLQREQVTGSDGEMRKKPGNQQPSRRTDTQAGQPVRLQAEPGVCQGDDGLSGRLAGHLGTPASSPVIHKDEKVTNRVQKLKALGNAVVPQIPHLLGRAIMECEGC